MRKLVRFRFARFGVFLADCGNWLAGHHWGVNLYEEGMRHGLEFPEDCREYLRDTKEGGNAR